MPFSAWSENDPAGSDAASSINEAATRAAVRIRERMDTVAPDWDTATDRIHFEKFFINSSHLTLRDDTDAATLGSITAGGIVTWNNQPRCRLRKATTWAMTNGAYASVVFDTEDFDVGSLHDNVTNNTRVTIPALGGGIYLFAFESVVTFPASPAASYAITVKIRKNGASDEVVFPSINHTVTIIDSVTVSTPIGFTSIVNAAAADYYEVQVNPNFAGSIAPHLSVIKLA